jgi:hypothetical protein
MASACVGGAGAEGASAGGPSNRGGGAAGGGTAGGDRTIDSAGTAGGRGGAGALGVPTGDARRAIKRRWIPKLDASISISRRRMSTRADRGREAGESLDELVRRFASGDELYDGPVGAH